MRHVPGPTAHAVAAAGGAGLAGHAPHETEGAR
jgi:hypothetical protein